MEEQCVCPSVFCFDFHTWWSDWFCGCNRWIMLTCYLWRLFTHGLPTTLNPYICILTIKLYLSDTYILSEKILIRDVNNCSWGLGQYLSQNKYIQALQTFHQWLEGDYFTLQLTQLIYLFFIKCYVCDCVFVGYSQCFSLVICTP